ncbi:hypothetical protein [Flavobacterium sp.]|uniref:hypothetical protein n=1 Tax=Flavobacterium sp. TaxID=239 RepID=UPI00286D1294|nr:hypothetical protein [Flavobacterium sp.]
MKSKLIFCSLLALSITFMSCKKEENKTETEADTTSTTQQPIIVPNVQPIPSQSYAQPNQQVITPTQNTTQTVTQTPVVTKAGMNPPHGQAGHRCDIAVGAPLNSPVAKAVTPPTTTQGKPSFTTTTTSTPNPTSTIPPIGTPELLKTDTPAATAPGMNPPHGQEGHSCDIAVGQPLPKS